MTAPPLLRPVAEHALLVEFGTQMTPQTHQQVLQLDAALTRQPCAGFGECVPGSATLLVCFDPLATDHQRVGAHVLSLLDATFTRPPPRLHQMPVCYEAGLAPDLAAVAQAVGLSPDAVIAQHLAAQFEVSMYGFAPGYAYLTGVPQAIRVPRKAAAIRGVPWGSVLMAGQQCIVSTLTMPTGWSIIGRSPRRVLTADADHPFLFEVGDLVRFTRISRAQFDQMERA